MKFSSRIAIALSLVLAGSLKLAGTAADAKEFRSSDVHSLDYPTVLAVAKMDGLIRERTANRHSIVALGNDDQQSELYTISELRNGTLDMARVNLAAFNTTVPSTMVLSLPFLFRSKAHLRRVLDGPIGAEILADLDRQDLIGLCFYDTGARSFYSIRKPIRNAGDLKGLTVRVQPGDKSAEVLIALGATPVPMSFDRIHDALKAGLIDAAVDNWPSYITARHYEVAPYFSLTEHNMAPGVLVFSKRVWDTLDKADQAIIRTAAQESAGYLREVWDTYESKERMEVATAGPEIVSDVDRKSFSDILVPLYAKLVRDPRLQTTVTRIRATD